MKRAARIIIAVLGLLIFINSLFLLVATNFNLGNILAFILGLTLLLYAILFDTIHKLSKTGFLKALRYLYYVSVSFFVCISLFLALYGNIDTADYDEDVLIVLGCAIRGESVTMPLAYRLNEAVYYHEKNPDAYIVVTGGQGMQESITEAEAMERYLIKRGVNPDVIIKEEKATSTHENFVFSKEILDEKFDREYKTAIVTNGFHIYRSKSMAKETGFENVTHMGAKIEWYVVIPNYLRECLAVVKHWVFKT